ncbi:hypothetical protein RHSIM_Rhsim06G0217800 [Rhododendron simsii]|uniref:Uncharacterized protein n=1 Tax=Rhododendron simsii TaxID=118357 RepID=A0A834GWR3_RHOSS|nr:hypothetical protein RHSIM_Rhsim06G0217800 [Rhododendron simsii]
MFGTSCEYSLPVFNRELITLTYHLKKLNMLFVPKLSNIYLNLGDIGLVSIMLNSCGPDRGIYIDPLVGYCTEVMYMLLKSNKLLEFRDLQYVACRSKWW